MPNSISITLCLKISTTALRRRQTQLNLENKHTNFFYSKNILLKNVLTVGISERQRCMSRGVGRCSSSDSFLKWWLSCDLNWKNSCFKTWQPHTANTPPKMTSIHLLIPLCHGIRLSFNCLQHLTHLSDALLMICHLQVHTQSLAQ